MSESLGFASAGVRVDGEPESTPAAPHQLKSLVALGLLAVFLIVWVLIPVFARLWPHHPWDVLVRGCEAALVGGLCDWFAVVRTYQAIEANRDTVAEAIGDWVSGELLSERVIQGRLDALVDDPDVHERLCLAIERKLGSSSETRELVAGLWKSIEKDAVDLVVRYDLRESDLDASKALLGDQVIFRTASRCLGEAVIQLAAST